MDTEPTCEYSAIHNRDGVPATTSRDLAGIGRIIHMCKECAAFYDRMTS